MPRAAELAGEWIGVLRERGWDGDSELADQLSARIGVGATPMLRPLPVDLGELAGILEGDPVVGGGRLDLRSGEVWAQPAIDYALEIGEEDEGGSDPPWWLRSSLRAPGPANATYRNSSPPCPARTVGTGW